MDLAYEAWIPAFAGMTIMTGYSKITMTLNNNQGNLLITIQKKPTRSANISEDTEK